MFIYIKVPQAYRLATEQLTETQQQMQMGWKYETRHRHNCVDPQVVGGRAVKIHLQGKLQSGSSLQFSFKC